MGNTFKIPGPRRARVSWLDKQLPNPADQREYARERCIVAITEALAGFMQEAGLSRSELAERLGVSKAHISQILNGSRNMTLGTLADILWACGKEASGVHATELGICVVPPEMAERDQMVACGKVETAGARAPDGIAGFPVSDATGVA